MTILRTALVFLLVLPGLALAQEEEDQPETLFHRQGHLGFVVSPDVKVSSLAGNAQAFTGLHLGLILHHHFLVGVAGYGSTEDRPGVDMGYGGVQLEYFAKPNKLLHYSLRALIGGGSAEVTRRDHHLEDTTFFVFEPEARVTLNVARHFRFGFGFGYRFADAGDSGLDLSAPVGSFSFQFGRF